MTEVDRIQELKQEVIVRVRAISDQESEKKAIVSSYNETIKYLKAERDQKMQELKELEESSKVTNIEAMADDILAARTETVSDDLFESL